jgi:hypothetical protein
MSIVWDTNRARPIGVPRSLADARRLAQKLEDRYGTVHVVLPAV